MKKNLLARIMGVSKTETTENTQETTENTDERAIFMGSEVSVKETQEHLDELDPADRVLTLTSNRKCEIFEMLEKAQRYGVGETQAKALFEEYKECLDDELMETYDDWDEAFWCNSSYLKKMMNRKRVVNYWKNKE